MRASLDGSLLMGEHADTIHQTWIPRPRLWCNLAGPPAMAFDQALLDKIRAAVDIADVVGEYVPLKKAGSASLKGLCPFHKEKSPSFNVNTRMQIFKCFGCSAAGSVFTFLSRIENIPFPEAVRRLADRAKIPLPDASPAASREEQEQLRMRQALETAAALYQQTLASPA